LHSGGTRFTDAGNYGNTMRLAGFSPFPVLRTRARLQPRPAYLPSSALQRVRHLSPRICSPAWPWPAPGDA